MILADEELHKHLDADEQVALMTWISSEYKIVRNGVNLWELEPEHLYWISGFGYLWLNDEGELNGYGAEHLSSTLEEFENSLNSLTETGLTISDAIGLLVL